MVAETRAHVAVSAAAKAGGDSEVAKGVVQGVVEARAGKAGRCARHLGAVYVRGYHHL